MKHKLKRKSENWRRKLPRPIVVRNGKTLKLLSDCRDYVLDLDPGMSARIEWQQTAELMLAASEGGTLEPVMKQFETILFIQGKLVLAP